MVPRSLLPALLSLAVVTTAGAADRAVDDILRSSSVLGHVSVITATPDPHEADMCRGFSLTESEIRTFFKKARVMASDTVKHDFQWAPCEVVGYFLYQDQKFRFSINAAATGAIELAPGQSVAFGCASICKAIFDYGYIVPPADDIVTRP
jgi:hypothetical protein